jgi:hypothetical protein
MTGARLGSSGSFGMNEDDREYGKLKKTVVQRSVGWWKIGIRSSQAIGLESGSFQIDIRRSHCKSAR